MVLLWILAVLLLVHMASHRRWLSALGWGVALSGVVLVLRAAGQAGTPLWWLATFALFCATGLLVGRSALILFCKR